MIAEDLPGLLPRGPRSETTSQCLPQHHNIYEMIAAAARLGTRIPEQLWEPLMLGPEPASSPEAAPSPWGCTSLCIKLQPFWWRRLSKACSSHPLLTVSVERWMYISHPKQGWGLKTEIHWPSGANKVPFLAVNYGSIKSKRQGRRVSVETPFGPFLWTRVIGNFWQFIHDHWENWRWQKLNVAFDI